MTFLNASLLAGTALVALPIVLHLMMRRRPRHLEFPALRFVQRRQLSNSRQLQLRHWLLLALRCGILCLAALALARPSVPSAQVSQAFVAAGCVVVGAFIAVLALVARSRQLHRLWSLGLAALAILCFGGAGVYGFSSLNFRSPLIGSEAGPVAAAVVIDTAPHMHYQQENRTRLAVAQETAVWMLEQLPADSQVAVLDAQASHGALAIDLAAAIKAAQRMKPSYQAEPLTTALERAKRILRESPLKQREIYVLTDLTTTAWKLDDAAAWKQRWDAQEPTDVAVYLYDVGSLEPKNVALKELKLSADSLPRGGELQLEVGVQATGLPGNREIDVFLENPNPNLPVVKEGKLQLPDSTQRASETLGLTSGEAAAAQFTLRGLAPGVHHGSVRLRGDDGLALDDIRYFTLEVEEPRELLLVGGPGVSAREVAEAIAPESLRDANETRFRCTVASVADLAALSLKPFSAVALLDPGPLPADTWNRLATFAREGGGVLLALGPNVEPVDAFADAAAREFLGGRLGGRLKQPARLTDGYFAPESLNHPVFAMYRAMQTSVPWDRFPVKYYWLIDQLSSDARVVATFSNHHPAIIETSVGRGRVLLITTPASELLNPVDRPAWNELWAGEDAWPWFVLLNESLRYVSRLGEGRLNYFVGETAALQNDVERHPQQYQLFTPAGEVQEVSARDDTLLVRMNNTPGTYRLRGQRAGPQSRGFSSNLTVAATDLTRAAPSDLDALLGTGKYQLARQREEIHRVVGQQRVGQEMYPYVALLIVLALALEQLLANRFYQGADEQPSASPIDRVRQWWRSTRARFFTRPAAGAER